VFSVLQGSAEALIGEGGKI